MLTKAEIQMVRSLGDKRGRQDAGLFVAEGAKLVTELLAGTVSASGLRLRRVFCTEGGMQQIHSATTLPNSACNQLLETVSRKEMERISFLKTPSEFLALVEIPRWRKPALTKGAGLLLALDGVQDPGNMGTILRIADWFGIRDVVCSEHTADCFNPKVVQATMGAIARVRVHYLSLIEWLSDVLKAGLLIYGTFLDGETIYNVPLAAEGVIVMGSEGKGVSAQVAELVTNRLYIPSFPVGVDTSESLNVATATAIVCSEFRRRCL